MFDVLLFLWVICVLIWWLSEGPATGDNVVLDEEEGATGEEIREDEKEEEEDAVTSESESESESDRDVYEDAVCDGGRYDDPVTEPAPEGTGEKKETLVPVELARPQTTRRGARGRGTGARGS